MRARPNQSHSRTGSCWSVGGRKIIQLRHIETDLLNVRHTGATNENVWSHFTDFEWSPSAALELQIFIVCTETKLHLEKESCHVKMLAVDVRPCLPIRVSSAVGFGSD